MILMPVVQTVGGINRAGDFGSMGLRPSSAYVPLPAGRTFGSWLILCGASTIALNVSITGQTVR
jgi:hypothetical protein